MSLTITHKTMHYSRPTTLADRILAMPPSPVGLLAGLLGEAAELIAVTLEELERAGKLSLRTCTITGRKMFAPRTRAVTPEPEEDIEAEPARGGTGNPGVPKSRSWMKKTADDALYDERGNRIRPPRPQGAPLEAREASAGVTDSQK